MNPDPYDDPFAEDVEGDGAAEWPPGKPGRPYGVQAAPPGLVRDPSVSMAEAAQAPAVRPSRESDMPPPSSADDSSATEGEPSEKTLRRRQERFCQLYAVTGNAATAAWQAGYSFPASRNQGYRLLRRAEVQARVAELQRELARAIRFDHEVMLGKLESVYRQAIEAKYFNAAARIVEVQARVAGHLRNQATAATAAPKNGDK